MKKPYGKLTFCAVAGTRAGKTLWRLQCACGKVVVAQASNVKSGRTQSCGCSQRSLAARRLTTHGMSKSATYRSWYAMIARCKKNIDYVGRVKVCKRWLRFAAFYADMGVRPAGHTIERKDNNKDYCPENCRWATRKEQNRNTRHNVLLTFAGKTQCAAAWADELWLDPKTFRQRLYNGWTVAEAIGGHRESHRKLLAAAFSWALWW